MESQITTVARAFSERFFVTPEVGRLFAAGAVPDAETPREGMPHST